MLIFLESKLDSVELVVEIPNLIITNSPKSLINDGSKNKTVIRRELRKPLRSNIRDKNPCIGNLSTSKIFVISVNSSKVKERYKPRLLKLQQRREISATIIDRQTL